ncbi:MAG: tetratricopeptide repeat protein [Burkholderiales bacterium]
MLKRLFADILGGRRRAAAAIPEVAAPAVDHFGPVERLVRSRQLEAAAAALEAATRASPGDARRWYLHAEIRRLRGAFDEAEPAYRRALIADSRRTDAWVGLGDCRARAGDALHACMYYRTALLIEPGRADVLNELGLIALQRGNHYEATELFDQAVSHDPQHAEAWNNCGLVAASRGKLEKARQCFHRAVYLRPGFYTALCNLGLACRDLGRLDEAAQVLARAVQADPGGSTAWVNLASVHQDRGRLDEARAALERVTGAAPPDPGVATAYGTLLAKLGDLEGAARWLHMALEADADDAEARLGLAHLALGRGSYAEGWDLYESRLRAANSPRRRFALPEWDGTDPAGKTIMVYAEQGLGDTIMFASCLPDLLREAAGVMLHCEVRLWPLMQRSFPGIVRFDVSARDRVHGYAAIGSLPRRYRRSLDAFPRHAGYLRADVDALAQSRTRLAELGPGLKAGIAWRGGLASTGQAMRSLELADLVPLLGCPGMSWVSLQHDASDDEIAAFTRRSGIVLHRLEGVERDLDAAAAAISALDVVVTVCSSIAHLAGALGKRTLVLTPRVPAWRYGFSGGGMPWYPAVRLLRQPAPGDWQAVLAQARSRLADAGD